MSRRVDTGRREFLLGTGRYGLALLLGGGIGAMVAREGEDCASPGVCRDCAALDSCALPEALLAKQATRGQPG